jgi:hypothetical protein
MSLRLQECPAQLKCQAISCSAFPQKGKAKAPKLTCINLQEIPRFGPIKSSNRGIQKDLSCIILFCLVLCFPIYCSFVHWIFSPCLFLHSFHLSFVFCRVLFLYCTFCSLISYSFLYTTSNISVSSISLTLLLSFLFYLHFLYFALLIFFILYLHFIFVAYNSNGYFLSYLYKINLFGL